MDDKTVNLKAVLETIDGFGVLDGYTDVTELKSKIRALPSAQPDLDEWCEDCKEYDTERHSCPRWNRVIRQTIKNMKAEQQERWVPCKEQLPKNRDTVLVCLEFGILGLGHYAIYDNGPCWCFDDGNLCGDAMDAVKAWMPLPEPYKEDNNDTD